MAAWANTIAVICWILEIIITIFILKTFLTKKKGSEISHITPIRLGIALFVFELVVGIAWTYVRGCSMFDDYMVTISHSIKESKSIMDAIGALFIIISFVIILYVFISRLYLSFNNTIYDYPKCFYIFIISEATFVGIITFIGGVLAEIFIILGIAIFLHILNCIFLTILFIYSLKKIAPFKSTKDNEDLIETMIKYVALLSIAMITSLFLSILMVIHGITNGNHDIIDDLIIFLQPIDASINVLCVYLQFEFTHDHYVKFMAKYHNFVENLFAKQMKTEINLQQEVMMSAQPISSDISDPPDAAKDESTVTSPTTITIQQS